MCSDRTAIHVDGLGKCYEMYHKPHHRLLQTLCRGRRKFYEEFWALKDVSFDVKKGETVGIIGRNGSGKSTLLEIICGTLNPTLGNVQTKGRIAALLELGSGFNPEFTGRENVRMSCALLGLSAKECEERFDEIAAFADIGDFIEQPVKSYSSGMYVRLAFAVNIVSDPDIMVVDEALAVGDMNFQAKCMTALTRIQEKGATVLFVSHDIGSVKSLCQRAVYLEHGRVKAFGDAPEVAELYVRSMREEMNEEQRKFIRTSINIESDEDMPERVEQDSAVENDCVFKKDLEFDKRVASFRYGSGGAKITYVELLDMDDAPLTSVAFNQEVKIRIHIEADSERVISINFNILDDKKIQLVGCAFPQAERSMLTVHPGEKIITEYKLKLPLMEGLYSLRAQIGSPVVVGQTAEFLDVVEDAVVFRMERWAKARIWSKVHLFPKLKVQKLQ